MCRERSSCFFNKHIQTERKRKEAIRSNATLNNIPESYKANVTSLCQTPLLRSNILIS
jgi:hypothetical protein